MELQVNNKKLFKVDIFPTTTIAQLKQTIKGVMVSQKYNKDDYTVRLIFNNGEELLPLVFQTNTYDNADFQSHDGKIQGGQIYINTPVKVVKGVKGVWVKEVPMLKLEVPRPGLVLKAYSDIRNLDVRINYEYEKAVRNQFLFQILEDLRDDNFALIRVQETQVQDQGVADNLMDEFVEKGYYTDIADDVAGEEFRYTVYINRPLDISSSSSSSLPSLEPGLVLQVGQVLGPQVDPSQFSY